MKMVTLQANANISPPNILVVTIAVMAMIFIQLLQIQKLHDNKCSNKYNRRYKFVLF